jgi:hypothetical protein
MWTNTRNYLPSCSFRLVRRVNNHVHRIVNNSQSSFSTPFGFPFSSAIFAFTFPGDLCQKVGVDISFHYPTLPFGKFSPVHILLTSRLFTFNRSSQNVDKPKVQKEPTQCQA